MQNYRYRNNNTTGPPTVPKYLSDFLDELSDKYRRSSKRNVSAATDASRNPQSFSEYQKTPARDSRGNDQR